VDLEGLDALFGQLDALVDDMKDAALKGLDEGLRETVSRAKFLAPVDTGQLRDSITSEVERRGDEIHGKVAARTGYATYVELGTRHQPAQPYLYPAAKETEDAVKDKVAGAVNNTLRGGG